VWQCLHEPARPRSLGWLGHLNCDHHRPSLYWVAGLAGQDPRSPLRRRSPQAVVQLLRKPVPRRTRKAGPHGPPFAFAENKSPIDWSKRPFPGLNKLGGVSDCGNVCGLPTIATVWLIHLERIFLPGNGRTIREIKLKIGRGSVSAS
jgi:hypothetical protein